MSSAIGAGAPLPEKPDKRWEKIVAPKGMTPLAVTLLSDGFIGFWLHYSDRAFPCTGDPLTCAGCKAGLGHRWSGYCAAWVDHLQDRRVLALTEGAARQLLPYITKHGSLRGWSFYLQRAFNKPNAPVQVRERGRVPEGRLPPDFDIIPHLQHMWGVTERMRLAGRKWARTKADVPPDEFIRHPRIAEDLEGDDPLA